MAFNIIERDYKFNEEKQPTGAVCSIYCDSSNDLPTTADITRENMLVGSWAWLGSERTFKTLSSGGEWV